MIDAGGKGDADPSNVDLFIFASVPTVLSQVLKGDLKSAIEMHEMLYQIIQRHNFLPEVSTVQY